jgi:hypothetical protein
MNVEIGTVATQFLFWEYLFSNFRYCIFAAQLSWRRALESMFCTMGLNSARHTCNHGFAEMLSCILLSTVAAGIKHLHFT